MVARRRARKAGEVVRDLLQARARRSPPSRAPCADDACEVDAAVDAAAPLDVSSEESHARIGFPIATMLPDRGGASVIHRSSMDRLSNPLLALFASSSAEAARRRPAGSARRLRRQGVTRHLRLVEPLARRYASATAARRRYPAALPCRPGDRARSEASRSAPRRTTRARGLATGTACPRPVARAWEVRTTTSNREAACATGRCGCSRRCAVAPAATGLKEWLEGAIDYGNCGGRGGRHRALTGSRGGSAHLGDGGRCAFLHRLAEVGGCRHASAPSGWCEKRAGGGAHPRGHLRL
jgi:hypothetical protein